MKVSIYTKASAKMVKEFDIPCEENSETQSQIIAMLNFVSPFSSFVFENDAADPE
jgi:hypothetical protein